MGLIISRVCSTLSNIRQECGMKYLQLTMAFSFGIILVPHSKRNHVLVFLLDNAIDCTAHHSTSIICSWTVHFSHLYSIIETTKYSPAIMV